MKHSVIQKIASKYQLVALFIVVMATFFSCDDPGELGMELLPHTDLIEVKSIVETDHFSSFTFREDSVLTSMTRKSLLGSFHDPVFGKTNIDFAAQFRLQRYPDFGTNPVVDSLKLVLYYRLMYGDTVTPQTFRVYELNAPLQIDDSYFQDVNLKELASDELLGEQIYTPVVELDSVNSDTVYQRIAINLDAQLGEKLLSADSLQMIDNDVFLEFFKGLYIETEEQSAGGAILTLEAASSGSFPGSALVLYYDNDENRAEDEPDTLFNPYVITQFSARVNAIEHNYSGTAFVDNLNSESGDDTLIYVQPTGGLKSKIYIDGLSSWKDSVNMAINKAELVFQVDTLASEVDKFPPPGRLYFTYIDENGEEQLPDDYWFYPAYYGGYLNKTDYTYRFKLTQHLQNILDGTVENNGFFLTSVNKNSEANRVVLKGSGSDTGIKLVVTYSKFRQ